MNKLSNILTGSTSIGGVELVHQVPIETIVQDVTLTPSMETIIKAAMQLLISVVTIISLFKNKSEKPKI